MAAPATRVNGIKARYCMGSVLILGLLHVAAFEATAQTPVSGSWIGKAVVPKTRIFHDE